MKVGFWGGAYSRVFFFFRVGTACKKEFLEAHSIYRSDARHFVMGRQTCFGARFPERSARSSLKRSLTISTRYVHTQYVVCFRLPNAYTCSLLRRDFLVCFMRKKVSLFVSVLAI